MPNPAILNILQTGTKQKDCQVFGEKSFDFFLLEMQTYLRAHTKRGSCS